MKTLTAIALSLACYSAHATNDLNCMVVLLQASPVATDFFVAPNARVETFSAHLDKAQDQGFGWKFKQVSSNPDLMQYALEKARSPNQMDLGVLFTQNGQQVEFGPPSNSAQRFVSDSFGMSASLILPNKTQGHAVLACSATP